MSDKSTVEETFNLFAELCAGLLFVWVMAVVIVFNCCLSIAAGCRGEKDALRHMDM